MNITAAFPSKFLRAADLESDATFTIKKVDIETVGQGNDADEKPVVYFKETDKGLALNKTNANTIANLYGGETNEWVGKQVTLFPTEVDFGGKQTLAIRVRSKKPVQLPSRPSAPPAENPMDAPVDPKEAARIKAWNAFLEKWTQFELEHPEEAPSRNTKWNMALADYAKTLMKPANSFDVNDYLGLAKEIKENFNVTLGGFMPI